MCLVSLSKNMYFFLNKIANVNRFPSYMKESSDIKTEAYLIKVVIIS
jgi:hypothetical protein